MPCVEDFAVGDIAVERWKRLNGCVRLVMEHDAESDPEFEAKHPRSAAGRFAAKGAGRKWREAQTKEPEFRKWFADSKIVDDKGKPLVVYHGSPAVFDAFDIDPAKPGKNETSNLGAWFTDHPKVASKFAEQRDYSVGWGNDYDVKSVGSVMPVYLQMRNPKVYRVKPPTAEQVRTAEDARKAFAAAEEAQKAARNYGEQPSMAQVKSYSAAYQATQDAYRAMRAAERAFQPSDPFEQMMDDRDEFAEYIDNVKGERGHWRKRMVATNRAEASRLFAEKLKAEGYDGIVIEQTEYDSPRKGTRINQYCVFTNTQVKSALNRGTWEEGNPHIGESLVMERADDPEFEDKHPRGDAGRFATKGSGGQTDSPEFREWFAGSKLVDGAGKPLRLYHGTGTVFDEFSLDAAGKTDEGWFGKGFYFSPQPDVAVQYVQYPTPNILAVYVSMKNPADWKATYGKSLRGRREADEMRQRLIADGYDGAIIYGDTARNGTVPDAAVAAASKWYRDNHPGQRVTKVDLERTLRGGVERKDFETYYGTEAAKHIQWEREIREVVALYPEQVKSATGNRGTWAKGSKKLDEGWVRINGVARYVMEFGEWREEEHPRDRQGRFIDVTVHGQSADVKKVSGKWQFKPKGKPYWRVASPETATEIAKQVAEKQKAPELIRQTKERILKAVLRPWAEKIAAKDPDKGIETMKFGQGNALYIPKVHYILQNYGLTVEDAAQAEVEYDAAWREFAKTVGVQTTEPEVPKVLTADEQREKWKAEQEAQEKRTAKENADRIAWAKERIDNPPPPEQVTAQQWAAIKCLRRLRELEPALEKLRAIDDLKTYAHNHGPYGDDPKKLTEEERREVWAKIDKMEESRTIRKLRREFWSPWRSEKRKIPTADEALQYAEFLARDLNNRLTWGTFSVSVNEQERYRYRDVIDPLTEHANAVRAAMETGKPVANEVAADYQYQDWCPASYRSQAMIVEWQRVWDATYRSGSGELQRAELSHALTQAKPELDKILAAAEKIDTELWEAAKRRRSNEDWHSKAVKRLGDLQDAVEEECARTNVATLPTDHPLMADVQKQFDIVSSRADNLRQARLDELEAKRLASDKFLSQILPAGDVAKVTVLESPHLDEKGKQNVGVASRFLSRILAGQGTIELKTMPIDQSRKMGERACAHGGEAMEIAPNETVETIVHEAGHNIDTLRGTNQLSKVFAMRALAESGQKLRHMGSGYEPDEFGNDDKFWRGPEGRPDYAAYCSKYYHSQVSEVLSMGVQYLYQDAWGFYVNSPEHFRYVLAVLHGLV